MVKEHAPRAVRSRAAAACRRSGPILGSGPAGPRCRVVAAEDRASRTRLESAAGAGESPVGGARRRLWAGIASTAAAVDGRRKQGRPLPKAEYLQRPIAEEYREGMVKSTPAR